MSRSLRAELARLVDARRRGTRLVLLFDYDGTLVPIAEHPRLAMMSDDTRGQLEQLALMPAIVIGVLSGRAIDDLRERVGLEDAYYVGTSGLELSYGDVPIVQPEPASAALVATVAMPVQHAVDGYVGAWLEQKPFGLTVHFRDVVPDHVEALETAVAAAIQPSSDSLRVVQGAMAIEIVPDLGWTKGTALRTIVEHVDGTGVLPLYAGDDANDAEAFVAATALGGIAIGVGPRAPSLAQHRLSGASSVGNLVDVLLDMLGDSEPQSPLQ